LERDVVRVAGPEALTFLDGQLSQDLKPLEVGGSSDSLLLQPQGKVVALVRVTRAGDDEYLLDVDGGWAHEVIDRLERFKLRTKATIEVVDGWRCLALRGPRAHEAATGAAADWPGLPGVDVLGPSVEVPDGVPLVDADVYEATRIEAGVPRMGSELTEDTIPAEATGVIERAVSFTKGCYTGQELVARVDSRGGNVRRRLCGVEFDNDAVPGAGTELPGEDGRTAATITSATISPRTGNAVALAYVGRGIETPTTLPSGAVVKALPLV
jgi:folate-binding protein YgfZ